MKILLGRWDFPIDELSNEGREKAIATALKTVRWR
jgi:hypothetical protein